MLDKYDLKCDVVASSTACPTSPGCIIVRTASRILPVFPTPISKQISCFCSCFLYDCTIVWCLRIPGRTSHQRCYIRTPRLWVTMFMFIDIPMLRPSPRMFFHKCCGQEWCVELLSPFAPLLFSVPIRGELARYSWRTREQRVCLDDRWCPERRSRPQAIKNGMSS